MISAQVTVFVMAFPDPFHTTLFTEGFYRKNSEGSIPTGFVYLKITHENHSIFNLSAKKYLALIG